MTGAAWTMLAVTWAVVFFFTGRFFWMVLTTKHPERHEEEPADGILRKDA